MEDQSEDVSFCPSFNSYSSDRLACVAARVGETFTAAASNEADEEFEFTPANASQDAEVPNFPLFNVDLLFDRYRNLNLRDEAAAEETSMGAPLREHFVEEDRDPPSSSSSDVDELDRIDPGTYCVWRPNASPSPGRCEKSNSTGSSRKHVPWRFPKLLRRSRSDGNKYSLGPTPSPTNKKREDVLKLETPEVKATAKIKKKPSTALKAHEVFYVRSKASRTVDKRKSYLPYRQDLFGFFVNVNGLAKGFPPF
ncbi:hypothetical protein K2173_013779 [Erythroxylum novogranatense]|uniref:Uncharacterized protein n=1 Tax=Erythroxylum novogranatense TaxID=1862640 RepID=A0AAV8SCU3_9ROSI|nr:hypothetical protein K2173_013779 [Erythroxylum novogranatense]